MKPQTKTINYLRHPNGQLSLDGVALTPDAQAKVELQLKKQLDQSVRDNVLAAMQGKSE